MLGRIEENRLRECDTWPGRCMTENTLASAYCICRLGPLLTYPFPFQAPELSFLHCILIPSWLCHTYSKPVHVWDLYFLSTICFPQSFEVHSNGQKPGNIPSLTYFCFLPQKCFPELEEGPCQPLRHFEATMANVFLQSARARSRCVMMQT